MLSRIELLLLVMWALGSLAMIGMWPNAAAQEPPGPVHISIASGGNKTQWLHAAIAEFNGASYRDPGLQLGGRPIVVESLQEDVNGRQDDYRSGSLVADILDCRIQPTIASPGEESWSLLLLSKWATSSCPGLLGRLPPRDIGPLIVRSPLVVAAWKSRAEALRCWPDPAPVCTWASIRALASSPDGWGRVGHGDWGKFKLGYGYVGETNTGTLTAAILCTLGAGRQAGLQVEDIEPSAGCGQFMADIERAKTHSGTRSDWLLEQMTAGGPDYLDAIVGYEFDVVAANQARGRDFPEPLVCIYPQDGTIVAGHPFTILDTAPWVSGDQARAATIFRDFLLSEGQQRAVLPTGLRPSDPTLGASMPIDVSLGANPAARIARLGPPDSRAMERLIETWHRVKKHAAVAIVIDKSAAMGSDGLPGAVAGTAEFIASMDRDDRLILWRFDDAVYEPIEGYGSQASDLSARIRGTPAGGGSALFDAISAAYGHLSTIRQARGDELRYGIVVISGSTDNSSHIGLGGLLGALGQEGNDPTGIRVHTVAIGPEADQTGLLRIAEATRGRFWPGGNMLQIYREIAAYY